MPIDRNPVAEGYEARSKKANDPFYVELRHPGVLDIRLHGFSDGEVIE